MKATRYIQFDAMHNDRFVGTFRYPYNPLFDRPRLVDLMEFLIERRPTLRYCKGKLTIYVEKYEERHGRL